MPIGFGALLIGCASAPDGTSQDNVADFIVAAHTIGCELRYDSDYAPIEFQAGLSREQALEISGYLLARGDAVAIPEGGVRVTAGPCAAA